MVLEVTLNIFSGRPNPEWSLEQDFAACCVSKLQTLTRRADGKTPLHPGLGYRGFIITAIDNSIKGPVTVFAGTVETPDGIYEDHLRELEKWLLQTASPHIDPNLFKMVEMQINR